MKTALVTGGAGFIGSHLVARLVQEGWRTRVLDNLSSGFLDNLKRVAGNVEMIQGDVCDLAACRDACRGVDTVFHLAAIASVAASVNDPGHTHAVTLGGTMNVLLAARDQQVRRLVFSSSASVYGNAETVPTHEFQPIDPQSPYASAKAAGELYCRNFQSLYEIETVVLRYFNVYGPRQSANSGYAAAIPLFTRAALTGARPRVYGDGLQTRDFVYVEDVAQANLLAATVPGACGGTFNVASGQGITILDLLTGLGLGAGRPLLPEFCPARAGEIRHSRADITQARHVLGYAPSISLHCGLSNTLEAMQHTKPLV